MNTSQSTAKIAKALLIFQKEVGKIKKTETNPFFKSKYAPLPQVLESIEDPLQKSGISFVQFPTGNYGLTTRIMVEDEFIEETYFMNPAKDDPQGAGSCITYMRRYALGAIFGLNIDEDDDANSVSIVEQKQEKQEKPWYNDFNKDKEKMKKSLEDGKTTKDEIIEHLERNYKLAKITKEQIYNL